MKRTSINKFLFTAMASGLVMGLCCTSACKKSSTSPAKTLYDTLGSATLVSDPSNPGTTIEKGRLGIRSVVDSTIFVIAADSRINGHFTVLLTEVTGGNLTGFEALSKNLTDFFCVATGAKDFTYGGLSMVAAHNPATNPRMNGKADSSDFNAFVSDLVAGAQQCGLSTPVIGRVGDIVGTLEGQVVQQ